MEIRKDFSIINKFSFNNILCFCLLLLVLNILHFLKFRYQEYALTNTTIWVPFGLGIILFIIAFSKIQCNKEKMGIILFGVVLIIEALVKLLKYRMMILFSIGLEILAIYMFYLSKQDGNHKNQGTQY